MSSSYEKVGRTAFVIAQWRCEETEEAAPLFSDHVANVFLNAETAAAAAEIAKASPSTRFLVRYRTRYFDNQIRQKMAEGVEQFVVLGSGLDTRSIRLGSDGGAARFYEVEQGHVLEYKRAQLEQAGYAMASTFVHAEYTSVDYLTDLVARGFDPAKRTFILWEGNIFYLEYESALRVLTTLRDRLERFEITFDYLSKKLIAKTTGYRRSEKLLDGFGSMGAPWNTGIDDIAELGRAVGLDVGGDFLIADYVNGLGGIQVDRTFFDDYRIGCLKKA